MLQVSNTYLLEVDIGNVVEDSRVIIKRRDGFDKFTLVCDLKGDSAESFYNVFIRMDDDNAAAKLESDVIKMKAALLDIYDKYYEVLQSMEQMSDSIVKAVEKLNERFRNS